jgi:hypothetical protein
LFDVTSGGVFWMVAVGPLRWAMRTLRGSDMALLRDLPDGIAAHARPDRFPSNDGAVARP